MSTAYTTPTYAVVTQSAAHNVAQFLERNLDTLCPIQTRGEWESVIEALYDLGDGTDAIITDPDLFEGLL